MISGSAPVGELQVKNIFVVPDSYQSPSGGNIYNRFLVNALKNRGLNAESLPPDRAKRSLHTKEKSVYWVDTLCVGFIDSVQKSKNRMDEIFLIVHHLRSLEPDLSREEYSQEYTKEQKVFDAVSGFLVTSPFTQNVLNERGLSGKPIFVVPPALSIFPSQTKKQVRGFLGLMVSNLIPRKGILQFLEELGKGVTEKDEFQIQIVGRFDIDPEYSQKCQAAAERNPILKKSVRFCGPASLTRLKKIYESSSIFISASKMETYGMALQEARSFRLPMLALDRGYVKAHISPGENGYVYRSIEELSGACLGFIREPERISQLQKERLDSKEKSLYSWNDAADIFMEQYRGRKG